MSFRYRAVLLLPDDTMEHSSGSFGEVVAIDVADEDVAVELYRLMFTTGNVEALARAALHSPALYVRGIDFAGATAQLAGYLYLSARPFCDPCSFVL